MDRKNRETEIASVLLSALHIDIFSIEDIMNGFVTLLESTEETTLDILDASNELALFLSRAVIDDVLVPLNLEEITSKLPPNYSGSGTSWDVEEEYERGGVVAEACQCMCDLGMTFFNHEVVNKALVMAMEKKNVRMLDLLQVCFNIGLITINYMTKGFTRVKDGLNDLALEFPNAKEKFNFYMEFAQKKCWLLLSFGSSTTESMSTVAAS
ncbi:Tetratricopeptide repeat (TPR)-containing protein [Hibiscus syriacus]|uniref:Tetratricopeptide repeat (TPR)-containing protein n=1 Tax=Hibiscus syriacus TaxID=106335 RepID=A0A6A2YQ00_HIBSY|nr:Tetratricopeptide repeat (TPR)-containing protein [Hibiscus syriacus]